MLCAECPAGRKKFKRVAESAIKLDGFKAAWLREFPQLVAA
jgi:hypothetical protein